MLIIICDGAIILSRKTRGKNMDIKVGDVLTMKKPHPCKSRDFEVLRIGADFKIRCLGCGRELMLPRTKVEKNIKKINGASDFKK